jgi:predicted AAA+ superfamily ATPase
MVYISCDLLQRYQELVLILQETFEEMKRDEFFYLFLDEITYIHDWDRAIKHFADLGLFRKGSILITGSDSQILKEAMKKFPGRRGISGTTDFHCYPLSFQEFVRTTVSELFPALESSARLSPEELSDESFQAIQDALGPEIITPLSESFNRYLLTGGFLPAINEMGKRGRIERYAYQTYQQWVIGDCLKRGKKEHFLKDIIRVLSERLATQVTSHSITMMTEIQHHATVNDYLTMLSDLDVLFLQYALREEKAQPAYKKAKKIHFSNPFIAGALIAWAQDREDPFHFMEKVMQEQGTMKAAIIEGCLASLFHRRGDVYYIKAKGEVDIAVPLAMGFLPVEIKWTDRLRREELKQILTCRKGIIGYRGLEMGMYNQLYVLPLCLLALMLQPGPNQACIDSGKMA